jgi:hypothetical protein
MSQGFKRRTDVEDMSDTCEEWCNKSLLRIKMATDMNSGNFVRKLKKMNHFIFTAKNFTSDVNV